MVLSYNSHVRGDVSLADIGSDHVDDYKVKVGSVLYAVFLPLEVCNPVAQRHRTE